jgi:hypothetical protein
MRKQRTFAARLSCSFCCSCSSTSSCALISLQQQASRRAASKPTRTGGSIADIQ